MPWPDYIIEISAYMLFLGVLATALRRGRHDGAIVVAGSLFGMAIELMFVHLAGGYEYGEFLVMFFGAPLWVACGWGLIIYSAHRTADELELAEWGRPAAAALMAVGLDFALDPVAEGLGWWHWKRSSDFFGVSYDNFVGWLLIVGVFSAATRFLVHLWGERTWMPFAALLPAVAIVGGLQPLWEALYGSFGEGLVFYAIHTAFLACALAAGWRATAWYRLGVPVYLHGLFLALLMGTGLAEQHPELYGVFALASSVSLLWALPPGQPARP